MYTCHGAHTCSSVCQALTAGPEGLLQKASVLREEQHLNASHPASLVSTETGLCPTRAPERRGTGEELWRGSLGLAQMEGAPRIPSLAALGEGKGEHGEKEGEIR